MKAKEKSENANDRKDESSSEKEIKKQANPVLAAFEDLDDSPIAIAYDLESGVDNSIIIENVKHEAHTDIAALDPSDTNKAEGQTEETTKPERVTISPEELTLIHDQLVFENIEIKDFVPESFSIDPEKREEEEEEEGFTVEHYMLTAKPELDNETDVTGYDQQQSNDGEEIAFADDQVIHKQEPEPSEETPKQEQEFSGETESASNKSTEIDTLHQQQLDEILAEEPKLTEQNLAEETSIAEEVPEQSDETRSEIDLTEIVSFLIEERNDANTYEEKPASVETNVIEQKSEEEISLSETTPTEEKHEESTSASDEVNVTEQKSEEVISLSEEETSPIEEKNEISTSASDEVNVTEQKSEEEKSLSGEETTPTEEKHEESTSASDEVNVTEQKSEEVISLSEEKNEVSTSEKESVLIESKNNDDEIDVLTAFLDEYLKAGEETTETSIASEILTVNEKSKEENVSSEEIVEPIPGPEIEPDIAEAIDIKTEEDISEVAENDLPAPIEEDAEEIEDQKTNESEVAENDLIAPIEEDSEEIEDEKTNEDEILFNVIASIPEKKLQDISEDMPSLQEEDGEDLEEITDDAKKSDLSEEVINESIEEQYENIEDNLKQLEKEEEISEFDLVPSDKRLINDDPNFLSKFLENGLPEIDEEAATENEEVELSVSTPEDTDGIDKTPVENPESIIFEALNLLPIKPNAKKESISLFDERNDQELTENNSLILIEPSIEPESNLSLQDELASIEKESEIVATNEAGEETNDQTNDQTHEEPQVETYDQVYEEPQVETYDQVYEEPQVETYDQTNEEPQVETYDQTNEEQTSAEQQVETNDQSSEELHDGANEEENSMPDHPELLSDADTVDSNSGETNEIQEDGVKDSKEEKEEPSSETIEQSNNPLQLADQYLSKLEQIISFVPTQRYETIYAVEEKSVDPEILHDEVSRDTPIIENQEQIAEEVIEDEEEESTIDKVDESNDPFQTVLLSDVDTVDSYSEETNERQEDGVKDSNEEKEEPSSETIEQSNNPLELADQYLSKLEEIISFVPTQRYKTIYAVEEKSVDPEILHDEVSRDTPIKEKQDQIAEEVIEDEEEESTIDKVDESYDPFQTVDLFPLMHEEMSAVYLEEKRSLQPVEIKHSAVNEDVIAIALNNTIGSIEKAAVPEERAPAISESIPSRESIPQIKEVKPQEEVVFNTSSEIDERPVTNEQYMMFVEKTSHRMPIHWENGEIPAGQEKMAIVNVSYKDAEAYAEWLGRRIPTSKELEKASKENPNIQWPSEGLMDWVDNADKYKKGDYFTDYITFRTARIK